MPMEGDFMGDGEMPQPPQDNNQVRTLFQVDNFQYSDSSTVSWGVLDCSSRKYYVCEFEGKPAGKEYKLTKEMLGDSVLLRMEQVDVPLGDAGNSHINLNGKMPSFKISWKLDRLEAMDMEGEVGEVGRRVESPGYGQPWEESWWIENHTYK